MSEDIARTKHTKAQAATAATAAAPGVLVSTHKRHTKRSDRCRKAAVVLVAPCRSNGLRW